MQTGNLLTRPGQKCSRHIQIGLQNDIDSVRLQWRQACKESLHALQMKRFGVFIDDHADVLFFPVENDQEPAVKRV